MSTVRCYSVVEYAADDPQWSIATESNHAGPLKLVDLIAYSYWTAA